MKRISLFIVLFLFLVVPGQGQVFDGHGESVRNLDQAFQKAVQDVELQSGVEIHTFSRSATNGTLSTYSDGTFINSNHLVRVLEQTSTKRDGVYVVDIRAEVRLLEVPLCPVSVFRYVDNDEPGLRFGVKSNGENAWVKVFWVSKTGECGPVRIWGENNYIGYLVTVNDNTFYPDFYIKTSEIKVPTPGEYSLVFIATPSRTCIMGLGINTVKKLEEWYWSLPSTEMRRPYVAKNIRLG